MDTTLHSCPVFCERQNSNIPLMNLGFWQVLSDNFSSNFSIKEWTPVTKSNMVILRPHERKYHYTHSYPLHVYFNKIEDVDRFHWELTEKSLLVHEFIGHYCFVPKNVHTHPIEGFRKFQGREDRKAKFFKGTVGGWTALCRGLGI